MKTIILIIGLLVCLMEIGNCSTIPPPREPDYFEMDKTEGQEEQPYEKIDVQHFGGATYTRWGRTDCGPSANKIYDGITAGNYFDQSGGGSNWLCLTREPKYLRLDKPEKVSYLYGTEYEFDGNLLTDRTNFNAPCAVCQSSRTSQIMIPGTTDCPKHWTKEYRGYLVAGYFRDPSSKVYECLDEDPTTITGTAVNIDNALMYFVEATCGNGLPCNANQYITDQAVTCVVCSQ